MTAISRSTVMKKIPSTIFELAVISISSGLYAIEPSLSMQVQRLVHMDQKYLQKAQLAINGGDFDSAPKDFMAIANQSIIFLKKTPDKGSQADWTKYLQLLTKDAFEGSHFTKLNNTAKVQTSISGLTSVLTEFQREFQ
jgi:hypothetical protein